MVAVEINSIYWSKLVEFFNNKSLSELVKASLGPYLIVDSYVSWSVTQFV